jgi:hypothetical protein
MILWLLNKTYSPFSVLASIFIHTSLTNKTGIKSKLEYNFKFIQV